MLARAEVGDLGRGVQINGTGHWDMAVDQFSGECAHVLASKIENLSKRGLILIVAQKYIF